MALPRVLAVIPVVVCALALPPAATAQTGSISGTIVFEGVAPGSSLPRIRVEARDPYQGDASWPGAMGLADSYEDGTFSVTGLAPGQYRVYFNPAGTDRAYQWYPDRVVPSGAQVVTVPSTPPSGGDRSLGTVTLHPGYTIEGDISYSEAAPDPSQIWVNAQEAATGEWVSWGQPDASHHYARKNLPAGKYFLTAWTGTTGYIHEAWPNAIYSSGATPIEVSASSSTADADFTLEMGRTITGHVLSGTTPVQGANVNAWTQNPCCFDAWSNGVDENGFYQIKGLPPGTYRLRVQGGTASGQPVTGERWNNRSSFDSGDELVLGADDWLTEHIDFSPEVAHTIAGTVCLDANASDTCDEGEEPLSVGITVSRLSDGACCEWSGSDGSGHYRVPVGEGVYRVQTDPPAHLIREYWNNKDFWEDADGVEVAGADVTGKDFSLRRADSVGSGLEGRVVGAAGIGIPGVDVQLNRWSTGSGVTSLRTGPDGYFRFVSLPAGDYRVYFNTGNSNNVNSQDYVSESWTHCQIEAEPCPEGVIDPNVQKVTYPTPRTSLGTFKLSPGGSISGTVCVGDEGSACLPNDTGLPAGLWVNLESVVSMGPGWQGPPGAQVGADGRYRIRGIPAPVSYRVRVDNGGTAFSTAYFVSATDSTPFSNLATPVQVTVGGHEQAKDLHLTQGGSISGHVYCGTGTGEPIPSMQVNANMNAPGVWYGSGVQTDGSGAYVIRGLPPGDYQIQTGGRGQVGSVGCPNPANETYPSMIPIVGTENVPGKDFHLENGTTISGNVQYSVGGVLQPVVNMRVSASDHDTGQYVSDDNTDSNGDYVIYGLPAGRDYRVQVNTRDNHLDPQFWNFIQEAWDNNYNFWQGDRVPAGSTGKDFVLELGGAISGRVTAVGSAPLTGANVSAGASYDGEGFWNNAQTDQNGFYIIRGLPTARYSVYADAQPRNYVPEYYDDVMEGDGRLATPVPVTAHPDTVEITPNIDFELAPGAVIKGRVRAAGIPVSNLRLLAYRSSGRWIQDVTDNNGEYEFIGLWPGDWQVAAMTIGAKPLAFQQRTMSVSGAGFPCAQGDRSDCVDFDLQPGTTIHVRAFEDLDSDGTYDSGEGRSNHIVFVGDPARGGYLSPEGSVGTTDEAGYFEVMGLPTGAFIVEIDSQEGYVTMYHDNAFRWQEATAINLPNPGDSADTSFRLVKGGTIRGRAYYDANGNGMQDNVLDEPGLATVWVNARNVNGPFNYSSWTNSDGDYTITGVLPAHPAGTPLQYRVWAKAQWTPYASEYFDRVGVGSEPHEGAAIGTFRQSLAEIVKVDGGNRIGIDFSLVLGGGVEGTVTDASTGAFLTGIQINVNRFDGDADGFGAQTDAAGHYLITGLPPDDYRVQARDDRNGAYVEEFYRDRPFWNQATRLRVDARPAVDSTLASPANFTLAPGGSIEGTVTGPNGPVANANISIELYDTPNSCCYGSGNRNTGTDGNFHIGGVPAGVDLRIRVNPPNEGNLTFEYWNDKPDYSSADRVLALSPGELRTGFAFVVNQGGEIRGTVRDPNGQPLVSQNVNAQPFVGTSGGGTQTDATGAFVIHGLPPGFYALNSGGNGPYALEYHDDKPDRFAADPVEVKAGESASVSFVLNIVPVITSPAATFVALQGAQNVAITIATDPSRLAPQGLCGSAPCSRVESNSPYVTIVPASETLTTGTFDFRVDVAANAPLGAYGFTVVNDFTDPYGDSSKVAANVLTVSLSGSPVVTGPRLLVGDTETGSVRMYSVADNSELLPRVDTTAAPVTIVSSVASVGGVLQPDGRYAYVAGNRALSIIDLRLAAEVARVPAPGLVGVGAVAATDRYIYAVSRELGEHNLIRVFDAHTWQPYTTITVGINPVGLAIDPRGRWLYVANLNSVPASLSIVCVNGDTCGGPLHSVATVAMPAAVQNSPRGFAFLPDGSKAYVVAQRYTYVLDTATRTFVDANGAAPGLGIGTTGGGNGLIDIVADTTSGKLLAYVGEGGGNVKIIDTSTNAILRTIPSPTLGLARLRATPDRLYLAYGASKDLYVVPTQGLVTGAPVSFTRIQRDTGPTTPFSAGALLVVAEPAAPSGPTVGGPSTPTVRPNDSLTISGTGFDASEGSPTVWLVGSQTRLLVTGGDSGSLNVTLPDDTPAGTFRIAVTNPHHGGNDSGISSPADTLRVLPKPGYAPTQNVLVVGGARGEVRVFSDDQGGFESITGMEAAASALALTPDGKRGVVQMQYYGAQTRCDELPQQLADMLVFSLEIGDNFRSVLPGVRLPYVSGGFESPAVTSNPNGTFVYQPNRFWSDSVSVIDPNAPAEVDIDSNPSTQTYADVSICNNFDIGSKLPGLNRIHLDEAPRDLNLNPNEASATPDGSLLYVVNQGVGNVLLSPTTPGSVSVLDAVSLQARARITKYGPQGDRRSFGLLGNVAVSPLGDLVYVAGFDADGLPSLFVLKAGVFVDSAASFAEKLTLPFTIELPRGLTVSPDGSRIYVMARLAGNVHVVNRNLPGQTHSVGSTIPLSPGISAAAVAAEANLLYVANVFRDVVHAVDMASNANVANLAGPLNTSDVAVQAASGPRLDRVSPNSGPAAGGTPVLIVGNNFASGAEVRFGGSASCSDGDIAAATVLSASTISVVTPSGLEGPARVKVKNVDGQCGSLPNGFTYVASDDTSPRFTTPPYVASQSVVGPPESQTVTVEVRWLTDEASTSCVAYGMAEPSAPCSPDAAYVTSHLVTLTGLQPDTLYHFRATSADAAGNAADSNPDSFTTDNLPDHTPPQITSGPIVSTTDNSAVVQWRTDEDSTSVVEYDAMINGTLTSSKTGPSGTSHTVSLSDLTADTLHEYLVKSADASGNTRVSALAGFQTKPVPDATPPALVPGPAPHTTLGPFVSYLSNTFVIITWQTDEPSTSFVNYGISSIWENGVLDVSLVTIHVVFLTNLQANTSYGFQVGSSDAAGNTISYGSNPFGLQAASEGTNRLAADLRMGAVTLRAGTILTQVSATLSFMTEPLPDETPPALVANPIVTPLSFDRVLIEAETNEAASVRAQFGMGGLTTSAFDPTFSEKPTLLLTGLQGGQTYQLALVFTDPKGNASTPSGLTFTTPQAPDAIAPILRDVASGAVTATSAVVTWTTDEPADSGVRFGHYGMALVGAADVLGLRKSHSVLLNNLTPDTAYDFRARSHDGSGNLGTSDLVTFKTRALPPLITSLAPNLLAQGANTTVGINGQHFEAGATVDFGPGVTVSTSRVNAAGTRIDVDVTVAGYTTIGLRGMLVTNPVSTLTATGAFTIVDETPPTVTITQPPAEVDTTSVTVAGTLSETAIVTVNGVAASVQGLAFSATVTLAPGTNTISVTATDPSGNVGSATKGVKVMHLSLSDAPSVGEVGGPAVFTLTLSAPSAGTITVNYQTVDGSATAGFDFTGGQGSVQIPPNTTSCPLTVPIRDDNLNEDDETFTVNLTSAPGATITDGQGTASILDNDEPPTVSVSDALPVNEGNSGTTNATFTVGLSQASGRVVTVGYATADGSAQAGSDYVGIANGSVSFPPGTTSLPVNAAVKGDLLDEQDEAFFVNLSEPVNATLGDSQVQVTIVDDDLAGSTIGSTSPARMWVGLKNSDDQGTWFDMRAEIYANGALVSTGQTLCVTGVTRNASQAKEVSIPFGAISNGQLAPGSTLSVKFSTRIGTNPNGTKCGGHNNAVGLRLYYDAVSRPSRAGIEVTPDPLRDYFLHSSGSSLTINTTAPSSTQPKEKDSGSVNFNGGNPWVAIGTWSRVVP